MRVGTIMESNDATFFEDIFPMKDMSSSSHQEMPTSSIQELVPTPEPTISMEHVENPMEDNSETPKRSKRQRAAKSFGDDFIVYLVDDTPSSISEAYASSNADYWKEAVRSEMDSILANGTWEITDRPYGCKHVGCKWVFKKKLRHDGTIEKYKARLVAKGYTEKEGDDHWHALERIMRYLKGTASYGIHYSWYPRVLEVYSDSKWISDADEIKATSGYVFTLGGGTIFWKSCKQTILTRYTMEAELTTLDTAAVEAEWLRQLLMDLHVVEKPIPVILMNFDNQVVIIKVNSSKDNMMSSRHVKRRLKSSFAPPLKFSHPGQRRAPPVGTVGLRNPAASSPVREKGDKVFGERFRATTGFIMDADDTFPNDDFFPDFEDLFDDMGDNTNNGHAVASASVHKQAIREVCLAPKREARKPKIKAGAKAIVHVK
ncbi:hypothetical protein QYE76_052437 [Lolium multiflorum]|uniref:Reverse transcriptase Ty1/copia-type domain-containing protein n=1 Tax=Lolium multiflorum TaxID=4521 RepID=A0AAD8SVL6_LOLMU|nr:hypothetical protein QYE76_052437 [Lolium multiflorum]